jgi:hypothetical protein
MRERFRNRPKPMRPPQSINAAVEEFTSGNAVPMPVNVIGLIPMAWVVPPFRAFDQSKEIERTVCEKPMVTFP